MYSYRWRLAIANPQTAPYGVAAVEAGSRWVVPQDLYQPIRQDAVLLKTGSNNPAAIAFLAFLQSDAAIEIIQKYGYAHLAPSHLEAAKTLNPISALTLG